MKRTMFMMLAMSLILVLSLSIAVFAANYLTYKETTKYYSGVGTAEVTTRVTWNGNNGYFVGFNSTLFTLPNSITGRELSRTNTQTTANITFNLVRWENNSVIEYDEFTHVHNSNGPNP